MPVTRRVSVILPDDRWCSALENRFKWGIVERVEALGLVAEIFHDPRGTDSLCAPMAWSAANADFVSRRCVGALLIGLPRWHGRIGEFPPDAGADWFESHDFTTPFTAWQRELAERRDVFLGYCSASTATAHAIKRFLAVQGVTTLDWQTDFPPGQNILQLIGRAAARCSAGIFLFTRDDELAAGDAAAPAVPRDNVVFEAGYFIHAKGKDRVLVVREDGAKMPADLGGDIYAPLPDRRHIGPIQGSLRRFAAAL